MIEQNKKASLVLKCKNTIGESCFWDPRDNQLWWTDIPEKIRQNNSKKYGSASDLRTVRHRVITRLIYDAKNGKYQN